MYDTSYGDLALDLSLRSSSPARADALGFWALQMLCWNPALIIGPRASGDSRTISTYNSNLLRGIDLLGAAGRLLGALTTLAAALLLGEESRDPSVVDEVDGSTKSTKEDEVQENARWVVSTGALKEASHAYI